MDDQKRLDMIDKKKDEVLNLTAGLTASGRSDSDATEEETPEPDPT